jgi:hypothetical protein
MDTINQPWKIDQSWIYKELLRPPPTDAMNRTWLKNLQPGDIIETDREVLTVVRGIRHPPTPKGKGHRIYCVKVKRPHRACPATLRACKEFEDCVEIVWSLNDGWKQVEFKNWRVVRPQPQEPLPSP